MISARSNALVFAVLAVPIAAQAETRVSIVTPITATAETGQG